MSLIQNALKRKVEEAGQLPGVPTPSAAQSKKKWILLVGLLLILTAGNTIFVVHQLVSRKKEPVEIVQPEPEPAPAPAPTPVSASVPSSEPQKIVWPELIYSSLATKTGVPAVVINNQTLSVGESVDEVKVLKILKTMILLEFRGEKRVLRIDG